jgi:GNAT superfamily N-acetyltransferase
MTLRINKVDTSSRRDVDRFITLPWAIYKDTPQWVPPLVDDTKLMLDCKHYPFYQHSDADFFIAERDGTPVGRIAVLENRHYNEYWGKHAAFFYLFDAFEDREASSALFARIEEWAKARGLNQIIGAKGFLQGDGLGVLVEGFEHHPAVGIPYNHEYYGALIEAAGYQRHSDYLSAYLPGTTVLPERVHQIAEKMMERRGFSIKTFTDKGDLKPWIPRLVQTYNDTFISNWEFNPVTEAEAKVVGDRLLQIADAKLIKLVMKGDDIAGFLFGFPDISDGIRRANGRIWPFGWIHLLRDMKRTKWINLNGAGILAPYRGLGVNAILYVEMEKTMHSGNFAHADLVQMEEHVLTVEDTKTMGGRIYKKHRIYEKAI